MGRDLLIRSQILRDLFVFARSGPAGLSFRWLPGYREWLRVLNFGRLSLGAHIIALVFPLAGIAGAGLRSCSPLLTVLRIGVLATHECLKLSECASTSTE